MEFNELKMWNEIKSRPGVFWGVLWAKIHNYVECISEWYKIQLKKY